YFRLAAGYFRIIFTHRFDDRMFDRNFGGLGVVTDEPYLRWMVFHPRIFCCGLRDMLNQAALHTFMILAGNRRHAALQETGGWKRTGKVAGMKRTDHARQSVDCLWVKRMLDRRDTLCLERFDRLGDFVPEFDAADALIAALNSCGFALNFDLEPDPADASRLHREAAGLAGNAGIGLVAADDGVERAMTTDFLIDHYIYEDIALQFDSGGLEELDRDNVAGNTTLHVAG